MEKVGNIVRAFFIVLSRFRLFFTGLSPVNAEKSIHNCYSIPERKSLIFRSEYVRRALKCKRQSGRKGMLKMKAKDDLTGRRFGSLTVEERTDMRQERYCVWRCRCDCGNEIFVSTRRLKSGAVKSCGCRKHPGARKMRDITGARFGRLTALFPTERRDGNGSVFWRCRCECGNEVDVTVDTLTHGKQKSCGCLQKEVRGCVSANLHRIDGTCVEWLDKRKHRSDNTSGFRGVYPLKNGSYRVLIGFKRRRFYIGTFRRFEEAVQARLEAERLVHGGFVDAYRRWSEEKDRSDPFIFEVEKTDGGFRIHTNS